MHLPEENDSKIVSFFFYFIKTKIKDIAWYLDSRL